MYRYADQEPEEIDGFETYTEAQKMLSEYRKAYPAGSRLWLKPVRLYHQPAPVTIGADIYFLCPIEYLTTRQFSSIVKGCKIYIPTGRISFVNGQAGGKNGKSPAFGSVIVKIADKYSVEFVYIERIKGDYE